MKNIAIMNAQEKENLRVMLIDLANDHRAVVRMIAEGQHLNAEGRWQFANQYRIEAGIFDDAFCDPVGEWWTHELTDLYCTMTMLGFGARMAATTDKKEIAQQWAQDKLAKDAAKYEFVKPNRQN